MLEKMDVFFNNRIDGYEEHMLNDIASAREFYPFTAGCLPMKENARVLDLGCGTGLELNFYFALNPTAHVTGIDLAEDMLNSLQTKFADKSLTVVRGSYFDVPFARDFYDAAVSVESLHHFTQAEKIPLYPKIAESLRPDGVFVLTDYLAPSEEEEIFFRRELLRLKAEQGITEDAFYHYDTPLTPAHELEALRKAGFCRTEIAGHWENTYTILARKI